MAAASLTHEQALDEAQGKILALAGDALDRYEAAALLGTTHQDLLERIESNSVLGVMRGSELLVPSIQFVDVDGTLQVAPGLDRILAIFEDAKAGRWMALQYLVEADPILKGMLHHAGAGISRGENAVPIQAIKDGALDIVVEAVEANLGLNEG